MSISQSAVARVVGIDVEFKDLRAGQVLFLPQRIAVIGQGSDAVTYASTARQISSAKEAGDTYGFGSPIFLAAQQLFPANGDGVGTLPVTTYPLQKDGSGVAGAGVITPVGTQTTAASYQVKVAGIVSAAFTLAAAATVADAVAAIVSAINGVVEMPVIAADVTSTSVSMTSKWSGVSSNDISIEVIGVEAGIVFTVTPVTGGLVNPDVDAALALITSVWETLLINCMEPGDTVTLDKFQTWGDPRWGDDAQNPEITQPAIVFTGEPEEAIATAETIPSGRKDDRVNAYATNQGSSNLPLQIAARAVARIGPVADANPPQDYAGKRLTGLEVGTTDEYWSFVEKDRAVKAGLSTVDLVDGVAELSDTVTFYHPDGEPIPAYRYAVDIVKLQTIIFNTRLIFANDNWNGVPLIPDFQATVNPTAKRPKDAKAEIAAMIDSLALNAIISDPDFAKNSIIADIDSQNPKRLNVEFTVKLSGNANIIAVNLNFGFFFGGTD